MSEPNNEETINPQQAPDTGHDGKLAAEAARRRVQAKEANERADAAEATVADLKAQIAALKLSQAKQAVTAAHPELTGDLIEKYAPEGIDADGLAAWADKALGLVVALRGEAPVDVDTMSDTEIELAETKLDLARQQAVTDNPHVTAGVLDALCRETTPEGITNWAAEFERLVGEMPDDTAAPKPSPMLARALRDSRMAKVSPGKWAGAADGLGRVAQRLQR